MTRRVLVFGSTGQLAYELARTAWPEGLAPVFLDRQAADFIRPLALPEIVARIRPDAVIIAAAYTNVDAAEGDEDTAMTVNASAPGAIAQATAALSIPLVYISTDYVFDGKLDRPYVEDDAACPINAYGRTKHAGEIEVRSANPEHLILRTSWVFSAVGSNFLNSMLRLAESQGAVTIVADQLGCPTAAYDLAGAIAQTLPKLLDGGARWGTYHLAGQSETTWHGFAEAIFAELSYRGLPRPVNEAISSQDFVRPAKRPMNSRLSSASFMKQFGIGLSGFETTVPIVIDEALRKSAGGIGNG